MQAHKRATAFPGPDLSTVSAPAMPLIVSPAWTAATLTPVVPVL
jgi:hypothetical protein